MQQKRPELLAPAGSMEGLLAAVQNGCNAVYLGGKNFSARAYAQNFSLDELKEAMDYAHLYGVKVYLTINTLYKNSEIEPLLEFVKEIYKMGVDGVIVQDMGLAMVLRRVFPGLKLHASTQMTVHNLDDVKYLEGLGFERVVLARELTLKEIEEIVKETSLEIETFVHGALCISYSGRCLMSSLIGGRSGNRGRCAQPCRLPYRLTDLQNPSLLKDSLYLLSPKDICTLEILPELINAGIASFKIEGRMKRPEYTACVTRIYRKYIDLALTNRKDYYVEEEDIRDLMQIFNRGGFIRGYYYGKEKKNMISCLRPKNWGIKIGEVLEYNYKTNLCTVKLTDTLKRGDGVEIWTGEKDNPGTIVHWLEVDGNKALFKIKGKIKKGDFVYRTSNKALMDKLKQTYNGYNKKIDIFGYIRLHPDEPIVLQFFDTDGNNVEVIGDVVESAKKLPLTDKKIREQIGKMGNTPFNLIKLEIDMNKDIFIPISSLNAIRREGIERLINKRLNKYRPDVNIANKLPEIAKDKNICKKPELAVYLQGQQFDPLNFAALGIDKLYLDFGNITIQKINELKGLKPGLKIYGVLPGICRNHEMVKLKESIKEFNSSGIDGYLVGNLGEVSILKDLSIPYFIDFSMNVFNKFSLQHWFEEGAKGATLSLELNLKEISELAKYVNITKEVIVYGYLPVMISEYCPLTFGHCKEKKKYGLLDRQGLVFPILTDCKNCRSVIFNSKPLFLLDNLEGVLKNNFSVLRMNLTIETEKEGLELVDLYSKYLTNPESMNTKVSEVLNKIQNTGFTKGHFFRGVE